MVDERVLDRLYSAPPHEFVATRKAVATELRQAGDKEGAREVAAIRKPSLTAWVVNRLHALHPDDLEALFAAGERLRQAQLAAIDSTRDAGAADVLRRATREERDAVIRLVDRAASLLASSGHAAGPAQVQRLTATLHAAARDSAARDLVRRGRLSDDLEATGDVFGALAAMSPPGGRQRTSADDAETDTPRPRAAPDSGDGAALPGKGPGDAAARADSEERDARKQAQERERQRRLAEAEHDAAQAEARAARLEERAARNAREADRLEQRAATAREVAGAAADEARRARDEADRLRAEADRLA